MGLDNAPIALPTGLNDQQAVFVHEYLIDLDPSAAAERAGYSPNHGLTLVKQPYIRAAIERAIHERIMRTGINADRVLMELAKIGFADLRDVLEWGSKEVEVVSKPVDPDDVEDLDAAIAEMLTPRVKERSFVRLRPMSEIPAHAAAAIAEISETKDGVKVKMHSKPDALEKLGKHLGLFIERHEISGKNGTPIEVNAKIDMEVFARAAREMLEKV